MAERIHHRRSPRSRRRLDTREAVRGATREGQAPGGGGNNGESTRSSGDRQRRVERRIQELAPYARARLSSVDKRQKFLDRMVEFEVLADVAERRGYGNGPDAVGAIKEAMVDQLLDDVVDERVDRDEITERDIEQYYDENRADYVTPAARHVAIIEVDTQKAAQSIRADLVDTESESPVQRSDTFRRAAARYSLAPKAKQKGGATGWVRPPHDSPDRPDLARRIYALSQRGDVTEVFQVDGHWAIATFFEVRKSETTPLDQAREEIEDTLYEKRRDRAKRAFVEEARSTADIEVHQDVLADIEPPAEAPARSTNAIPTVSQSDEADAAQSPDKGTTSDP